MGSERSLQASILDRRREPLDRALRILWHAGRGCELDAQAGYLVTGGDLGASDPLPELYEETRRTAASSTRTLAIAGAAGVVCLVHQCRGACLAGVHSRLDDRPLAEM